MRQLRQLETAIEHMPPWGRALLAVALIAFSIITIYGRINTRFGAKVFSKIPEHEIRTNIGHIVGYTIVPVMVCIGYLVLLLTRA